MVPVLVHPSRVRSTASWRDVCFLHDAGREWNAAHRKIYAAAVVATAA